MTIDVRTEDRRTLDTPYGFIEYHELWSEDRHVGWTTAGFAEVIQSAFNMVKEVEELATCKRELQEMKDPAKLSATAQALRELFLAHRRALKDLQIEDEHPDLPDCDKCGMNMVNCICGSIT